MPPSTPESDLLHPADPSAHSDDWPILTLSSVEVFPAASSDSPSSSDFTSLLTADASNPLTVRGKLNSIPRDLAHLRKRASSGTELLEVRDVRQFAYGQYDDGAVDLWAAGAAGWFALRPSRAYQGVFRGMIEAIEVLYFLADTYRSGGEGTRSRKGKTRKEVDVSAEDVFARYAAVNGLRGEEAAMGVFERHRAFLIKSMVQGKEGIGWERTGIWAWMVESFPDDVEVLSGKGTGRRASAAGKAGKKRKRSTVDDNVRSIRSVSRGTHATEASKGRMGNKSQMGLDTPRTTTPMDTSESDSSLSTRQKRGRKGKSVLRPKTSKYVSLETEESGDVTPTMDLDPLHPQAKVEEKSPLLKATHPSVVRLSGRSHSRRDSSFATADVTTGADQVDEGIDMSLDNADDDGSDDDSDILIQPGVSGGPSMPVRLRKEHFDATGEGDTWSCPLDGCMHKVYAASEPHSQGLIKEHYRLHVNDEDAEVRIDLVRKMQAPGLPVNRLMSRIQKLAGQQGLPPPIVRRY